MSSELDAALAEAGRAGSDAWEKCMGEVMSTGKVNVDVAREAADRVMARAVLESLGLTVTGVEFQGACGCVTKGTVPLIEHAARLGIAPDIQRRRAVESAWEDVT